MYLVECHKPCWSKFYGEESMEQDVDFMRRKVLEKQVFMSNLESWKKVYMYVSNMLAARSSRRKPAKKANIQDWLDSCTFYHIVRHQRRSGGSKEYWRRGKTTNSHGHSQSREGIKKGFASNPYVSMSLLATRHHHHSKYMEQMKREVGKY